MKKLLLFSLLAILLNLPFPDSIKAQSYAGTDFWFAFMDNNLDPADVPVFQIHVTSSVATSGTVSVPGSGWSASFTVAANTMRTVAIPGVMVTHAGISDAKVARGVHLVLNDPCVVYVGNYVPFTSDVATAIPTNTLDLSYDIIAYGDMSFTNPSEFVVVATQNGTTLTVTLTQASVNKAAGSSTTVTLNQGETYHVRSKGTIGIPSGWNTDLTGSRVVADKPVAVYAGNQCGVVGGCGFCDHMFEQVPPINTWGKEYFVASTQKPSVTADRIRIYSSMAGTTYSINGAPQPALGARAWRDLDIAGGAVITSNNPIAVYQLLRGSTCSAPPLEIDPLMLNVLPSQQYAPSYIFATSNYIRYTRHYATIIIPTAHTGTLMLNGVPLTGVTYIPIAGTSFSYGYMTLALGTTYTISSSNNTPFGLYVYGYGQEEAYGYTAGGFLNNLVVPIGLISFDAVAAGNVVALNWSTASEKDNDRFEIQRSVDGTNFETIGIVSGGINSSSLLSYAYTDKKPLQAINYYRLKQVDISGEEHYSSTRSVDLRKKESLSFLNVLPNPVGDKAKINFESSEALPVSVLIFDITGRIVYQDVITNITEGLNNYEIPTSSLEKGIYYLSVEQSGTVNKIQTKFIKE